jgi:hypothetical protein
MADPTFNNPANYGAYTGTTNVWDVSQIFQVDVTSPEFKELLVRLYQNLNLMSTLLNLKDTGYYDTGQFVNGQQFFPNPSLSSSTGTMPTFRPVYRKVINFGALPNTGTKSVAHGITVTTATTFTRIYATASDTTGFNYIPIPYASPVLANNIELRIDATNVTIVTGSNRTNFTITYVIVEFLQT